MPIVWWKNVCLLKTAKATITTMGICFAYQHWFWNNFYFIKLTKPKPTLLCLFHLPFVGGNFPFHIFHIHCACFRKVVLIVPTFELIPTIHRFDILFKQSQFDCFKWFIFFCEILKFRLKYSPLERTGWILVCNQ